MREKEILSPELFMILIYKVGLKWANFCVLPVETNF
jgi:hypothetical protein